MKTLKNHLQAFAFQLDTDIVSLSLVFLCVFAVFCHYAVTNIILAFCGILLLFIRGAVKKIFLHKNSFFAFAFLAMTVITGIYYKNFRGLSLSFTFIMIAIIGFYLRSVMSAPLFEWALNLVLFACVIIFIGCTVSKLMFINEPSYRCTLWFYNSNYLGSLMAGSIIICAYKEITKQGRPFINYLLAVGCAVCIYFSGSMFAVLEVLVGVSVLLTLAKKHRLMRIFLLICAFGCLILFMFPNVFPRMSESTATTDNRILIWQDTIANLPDSIIFGKGFFTYRLLPNLRYLTSHAHNFVLECLLSFGVVGTSLLGLFFFFYYRIVFLCNQLLRKNRINTLILALSAGVLLHATTDMTMIWSQTALFYALIMSGIGADERDLELLRYRYHH